MPPRRSAPAASAAGPSQSQSARRRRAEAEDEDDEHDARSSDGGEGQDRGAANAEKDINARAAQLVRYALFSEYKRYPIKRQDITKNILRGNNRIFNAVFSRAQARLRQTFGMELVELRKRHKGEGIELDATLQTQATQRKGKGRASGLGAIQEEDEDEDEDEDGGEAGEGGVQATQSAASRVPGSKTYVLRSVLAPGLLAAMSNPQSLPDDDEAGGTDRFDDEVVADSGALLRWEKGDGGQAGHTALLGLRTLVLCLIMVLGRIIPDDALHAYLRRLNLQRDTILPYASTDSKDLPPITLDKYLDLLAKQGYLEKVRIPGPGGGTEGGTIEWRCGARADVEFSEKAREAFIEVIFFPNGQEETESEDEAPRRRRQPQTNGRGAREDPAEEREHARKRLKDNITKAAGGPLTGTL